MGAPPSSHTHYRICATTIPSNSPHSKACMDASHSSPLSHLTTTRSPTPPASTPSVSQQRNLCSTALLPLPSPRPVPLNTYVPLTLATDPSTPPRFSRLRQHVQTNHARIDLNARILDQLSRRLDQHINHSTDPHAANANVASSAQHSHYDSSVPASKPSTSGHGRGQKTTPSNATVRVLKFAPSPP